MMLKTQTVLWAVLMAAANAQYGRRNSGAPSAGVRHLFRAVDDRGNFYLTDVSRNRVDPAAILLAFFPRARSLSFAVAPFSHSGLHPVLCASLPTDSSDEANV